MSNPYKPPAIKKALLESIEKGEFVDFDKLKPKGVDARARERKDKRLEMEYSEETETYKLT
jgi:hypothetical protein